MTRRRLIPGYIRRAAERLLDTTLDRTLCRWANDTNGEDA